MPPPYMLMPVMVTSVPSCPLGGSTLLTFGAITYVNMSACVCRAPVSLTSAMSPVAFSARLAATRTILDSVADATDFASIPTSLTDVNFLPAPSRFTPSITTRVPSCPKLGVTDVMFASGEYAKGPAALVSEICAPDVAVMTTAPLASSFCAALTTTATLVSLDDVIVAAVESDDDVFVAPFDYVVDQAPALCETVVHHLFVDAVRLLMQGVPQLHTHTQRN